MELKFKDSANAQKAYRQIIYAGYQAKSPKETGGFWSVEYKPKSDATWKQRKSKFGREADENA